MAYNEEDTFPFELALKLGKTLDELDGMSWSEYVRWRAFMSWRGHQQAHQADVAAMRAGR